MKTLLVATSFFLIMLSCKTTKNSASAKKESELNTFYGVWKVTAFRFNDGRVMPGEYMGYPQYEFTKEGYRIKTLNEQPSPPPDSVKYKIEGDSIKYPQNPKFPMMKISKLKKDTLVLSSEKLNWYLHR